MPVVQKSVYSFFYCDNNAKISSQNGDENGWNKH